MKFSIVTISFNQGRCLEQTIQSIVEQEGIDLEYIVVDAGSTDDSRDIIERNKDHIAHVVLEPDEGPADGLNKGFARASGEVFGFINSDDFLLPGALSKVAAFLAQHPDIDAVTGDLLLVDERGVIRRRASSPTAFSARRFVRGLCLVHQQSTFFRRRAFERTSGFNVANRTCWDSELFIDMSLAGASFARLRQPVAAFRLHAEGISGSGRLYPEYRCDQERLIEKALGRPVGRWIRMERTAGAMARRLLSFPHRAIYALSPSHGSQLQASFARSRPAGSAVARPRGAGKRPL